MLSIFARLLLVGALLFVGCAPVTVANSEPVLVYLGQRQIPHGATFAGTVIGGLSGISYDPGRDCYYVISDDRSAKNPARFYTVALDVSDRGIDALTVVGTQPLRDEDGRAFPSRSPGRAPPDPEGIAFDAVRQRLYWTSEGERLTDAPGGPVLADPWVGVAGLDGRYLGRITVPANLAMSAQATGPRRNTTLEGLTLTPSGRRLFAGMEGPGYNDGAPADAEHGALTRITAFDVDSTTDTAVAVAQYAYPLEPATRPAETNGLTDLVALSETEFLVLERAFSQHTVDRQRVRVFRAELGGATDVFDVPALPDASVRPMTKTLLADLSALSGLAPLDNIEGITLGPRLPDGRRSVLMVSDDNFNPAQVTQFLLFALS